MPPTRSWGFKIVHQFYRNWFSGFACSGWATLADMIGDGRRAMPAEKYTTGEGYLAVRLVMSVPKTTMHDYLRNCQEVRNRETININSWSSLAT